MNASLAPLMGAMFIILVCSIMFLASRYRRCPSDRILVIYGGGKGQIIMCIHGGGALVWPFQKFQYLDLTPFTINIPVEKELSLKNISVDVPNAYAVGISVEPAIMNNAGEHLLDMEISDIERLARKIIIDQVNHTIASSTSEQINSDREYFIVQIRENIEPELNKFGLYLIHIAGAPA